MTRRKGVGQGVGGGKPSLYKPEFAEQAGKLVKLGATDMEISDFFGVDVRTIYKWKNQHDKFGQSLKVGKEEADERVKRSLYQRAIGYEQDAVKIFMPAGAGKPVYAPYRENVEPDTTACIFWLKNRQPKAWRDATEHKHSGSVTLASLVCGEAESGDAVKEDAVNAGDSED